jgi:hypothetical protein
MEREREQERKNSCTVDSYWTANQRNFPNDGELGNEQEN